MTSSSRSAPGSRWPRRILSVLLLLFSLPLLVGGLWLIGLGGSFYYAIAGALFLGCSALLWLGRTRNAMWLYCLLALGSILWCYSEVGFDWWQITPRLGVIGILAAALLVIPSISRGVRTPLVATVVIGAAYMGIAVAQDPHSFEGDLTANQSQVDAAMAAVQPAGDWRAYGRSQGGDRFSPLDQITPANVDKLKVAWQIHTGDEVRPNDPKDATFEDTPLAVNGTVYLCSTHQKVIAVDGATGHVRWQFDPKVFGNKTFQHMTCRGVSYHETPANALDSQGKPAPAECAARIYLPTNDARLIALDAKTGQVCKGFGTNGTVDLNKDMGMSKVGFYEPTSPPIVSDHVLVLGGSITDNYSSNEPSGVIRGYDVYTGRLVWAWDSGAIDENHLPGKGESFKTNSPNAWAPLAFDAKAGLVYLPMGVSTPDVWGGNRSPSVERYSSSIVALNVNTGHRVWSYQTVHHDLWDMDIPAQPSLVDLRRNGKVVPALFAPTKSGDIFVLNRLTGKLLVDAPETAVPQGGAPGERLSPTQPFSQLSFRPKAPVTGADMWGATMFDQLACRIQFHQLRYEGPFTPPSTQGTLVFPGNIGMFEWGGVAIDPERQIMVGNLNYMPFVSKLLPRGPQNPSYATPQHPPGPEGGLQPMLGTPYGVAHGPLFSPIGLPCFRPPWGAVVAVDLRTMKTAWQVRNGTIRDSAPLPIPLRLGVPSIGGPLITRGRVMFLTSTLDQYIRAYAVDSGKLLWEDRLGAGGQSTPMTYGAGGRQYVLTADGGHGPLGTKHGDLVTAYTLK